MAEKIVRIPFAEVRIIRFYCNARDTGRCEGAIEIPIDRVGGAVLRCPVCGAEYRRAHIDEALKQFDKAFRTLAANDVVGLEFVIPDHDF